MSHHEPDGRTGLLDPAILAGARGDGKENR
jgi:hypothetical protein